MHSKLAFHPESDEDEYENENGKVSFGPNINNTEQSNQNRELIRLGEYDPKNPHRTVYPGLNFEGRCENPKCNVKGRMVWVQLGYGTMYYAEKLYECPCPICKKMLKKDNIKNIGFRNARVKFVGRKENEELIEYNEV